MARVFRMSVLKIYFSSKSICFSTKRVLNCANPCTVDDLCSLVTAVADKEESAGELARVALNIRSTRRHLFRQLSSDGPSGRALVAARSAALLL